MVKQPTGTEGTGLKMVSCYGQAVLAVLEGQALRWSNSPTATHIKGKLTENLSVQWRGQGSN